MGMICESPPAHLHKQKQVGIILLKSTELSMFIQMGHLAQIHLEPLQYNTSKSSEVFLESLVLRLYVPKVIIHYCLCLAQELFPNMLPH